MKHQNRKKYTRKNNEADLLEGWRDARSASEGETRVRANSEHRRDSAVRRAVATGERKGAATAADDRTQGSEAKATAASGDGRQATGPAWVVGGNMNRTTRSGDRLSPDRGDTNASLQDNRGGDPVAVRARGCLSNRSAGTDNVS
jgi:hypothetical protein